MSTPTSGKAFQILETLSKSGVSVTSTRNSNDTGYDLRGPAGEVVMVYDTGKVVVQGKRTAEINSLLASTQLSPLAETVTAGSVPYAPAVERDVFVVYGHDESARTQLEAMLRRWRLEPIILDQLPSEGQTIIEKLERYLGNHPVKFGVVLATPDDEGHTKGKEDEKKFRARQNVVLELGMLLVKLGRARVAILIKEPVSIERPSDIQGLLYIPFSTNVSDAKVQLAQEMSKQGLAIDLDRL